MKAIKILLKKNCQGEYAKQLFFLVYILHKNTYIAGTSSYVSSRDGSSPKNTNPGWA